jgi:hypothetical protein
MTILALSAEAELEVVMDVYSMKDASGGLDQWILDLASVRRAKNQDGAAGKIGQWAPA